MAYKSPNWWRGYTKEQCARLLKSNKYRAECKREHKKEAYWLRMKTTRKMMRNNGAKDLTIAGYKQEMTVCRRCQQPEHIARDYTTNTQALAQSNKPAASGEGTGPGEVGRTAPSGQAAWQDDKDIRSLQQPELVRQQRSCGHTSSSEQAEAQDDIEIRLLQRLELIHQQRRRTKPRRIGSLNHKSCTFSVTVWDK